MRFVRCCQTMKTDLRGIFRTALNKCCREAERIPNVLLCRTSVKFLKKKHCLFFYIFNPFPFFGVKINNPALCFHSQPRPCVLATSQSALPVLSQSRATANSLLLRSPTLFCTLAPNERLILRHELVSHGYPRTTPTGTAPVNTSIPKTMTCTTAMPRTTCK